MTRSEPQSQEVVAAAPVVAQTKSTKKPKKSAPVKIDTGVEEPESYPSYPTSGAGKRKTAKAKSK